MSFKPIDIMKSQEVTHYKHIENQRNLHEQVQISKNFQENIHHERSKTTETNKTENNDIRYDAKEKGKGDYQGFDRKNSKNNNNKKSNTNEKETSKPAKSGGIDILI